MILVICLRVVYKFVSLLASDSIISSGPTPSVTGSLSKKNESFDGGRPSRDMQAALNL